ncbi:sirohydrochlorin chelatase [Acidithrix ferrooxidans]|uniref:Sirohydrochlorin cobaltochelatase n=1 Tax=Acidithrix ferrooxidans TaxID=1280514 RepID=A0A0D8HK35_9ACTN|nr:sirohydrochlorin chelatase [Acidithrix ferrooxidans]KJF18112.1 sirohydrochlorin cobaltochelatase [Acidithrix ferrooxidans]
MTNELSDIFIVGHGTKSAMGQEQLRTLVEMCSKHFQGRKVGYGFLELADPHLETALRGFITKDTKEITVIPLVLLGAGHAKSDIAGAVEAARGEFTTIEFRYGRDLSISIELIDAFMERYRPIDPSQEKNEEAILLVGRGSSDPDANSEVAKIARMITEIHQISIVESAFISLTTPSVPQGLERAYRLGAKRITVLPYFLFAGALIDRISQQAKEWGVTHQDVTLGIHGELGPHEVLVELIAQRIAEADGDRVQMSCDRCIYRIRTKNFESNFGQPLVVAYPNDHHHH